ncbi:MFS transporter [Pseudoduganella sp. GCM10020061]|uniref:MFS transporter n=1 Tax=Pseudoduganella sp. GCM10020061 TaxID=3317345 RepID=UPI003641D208
MSTQSPKFAQFLFSYYAHAGTFATYASLFFAARGMSPGQIGVLMSLIQVMRMIGPNLWGWVADRSHRRILVLRANAVAALFAFTGLFFAHDFASLFAVMVLLNLFTSGMVPLAEAQLLSEMRGDLSGYGRVRLWGSIGFILAVTGAGYGLEWWGVESLLWIAGALLLLVLAATLQVREAAAIERPKGHVPVLHVLRQPDVAAFFASTALMVAAHTSLYVYYSLYLERIGYSKPVIGAMWSVGVLVEIGFFYFQSAVMARLGARRLMMLAFAVATGRFILIGAGAGWFAVLLFAQLLHAVTFAAHHSSAIVAMQKWFAGPLQARGQALYMSIAYGVGGSAGGLFMSLCWEKLGPSGVYYAASVLATLGLLCARFSFRWQGRS